MNGDTNAFNAFFVAQKLFVMQTSDNKQVFNPGCSTKFIYRFNIFLNHFGLKTVFFRFAFSRGIQLFEIFFFENYSHQNSLFQNKDK